MNKFTKKQLLIGGLVLLVVINVAALTTFLYQNYKQKTEVPVPPAYNKPTERAESERLPDSPRRSGNFQRQNDGFCLFIKKKLDLNDAQFEQFKSIRNKTFEQQRDLKRQIDQKKDEMMKTLASETVDSVKLNKITRDIGNLHKKLNNVIVNHFTEFKALCTEEQKKELNELMRRMGDPRPHHMQRKHRNKR